KLETTVNNVVVDCEAEELKPHFFKKTGLFGFLKAFFTSLIAVLKRAFNGLVTPKSAKEGFLDEIWLNSLNAKAAKAKSATERVPEPMPLQEGLNRDVLNTTKPEAANSADKLISSPPMP